MSLSSQTSQQSLMPPGSSISALTTFLLDWSKIGAIRDACLNSFTTEKQTTKFSSANF